MDPLPFPSLFSHLFIDGQHQPPLLTEEEHELRMPENSNGNHVANTDNNAKKTPSSSSSTAVATAAASSTTHETQTEGHHSKKRRSATAILTEEDDDDEEEEASQHDDEEEEFNLPMEYEPPQRHDKYEGKRTYFWQRLAKPVGTFYQECVAENEPNVDDRGAYSCSFALHEFLHVCCDNIRYMEHNCKARKVIQGSRTTKTHQKSNYTPKLNPQYGRIIVYVPYAEGLLEDILDARIADFAKNPLEALEQSIKREVYYYITAIEIAAVPVRIPLEALDGHMADETRRELVASNVIEENADMFVDCWLYKTFADAYMGCDLYRKAAFAVIADHLQKIFDLSQDVIGHYTVYGIEKYLRGVPIRPTSVTTTPISKFGSPPSPPVPSSSVTSVDNLNSSTKLAAARKIIENTLGKQY